jgi:ABC-type Fe3+-siderophore transport system permease subunit
MDVLNVITLGIIGGGAIIIVSIALMLSAFALDFLPYRATVNTIAINISKVAAFGVCFGLSLFMLSLSFLVIYITIGGLWNREYILSFTRTGGKMTIISWDRNPVRFAFQTLLFMAVIVFLQYNAVKTIRRAYKKSA